MSRGLGDVYKRQFVIWATAIPVIPHIVMRVSTAKDARGAQLSLNLAMLAYSVMILVAVLAIVPVGKLQFPGLADADQVFLKVMESEFPTLIRGIAVAAVLAAVMSTTDALLLACSSAIAHDILGGLLRGRASERTMAVIRVGSAWVVGLLALYWALSPPELISRFYTAGIGLLSASLFVPTIAGLWWKRANLAGGAASLVVGAATYVLAQLRVVDFGIAPVVLALIVSAIAMLVGAHFGRQESAPMLEAVEALHDRAVRRTSCSCLSHWPATNDSLLVEVRPGGPQGDGVGYSDCNGWAATCALRRAGSVRLYDGTCAALVESPPVEPPERTSGTGEGNRGVEAQGLRGYSSTGGLQRLQGFDVGTSRGFLQRKGG